MLAAAVSDRDEETEWDPVPDTIVRLTSRQTAKTTPSPAEYSLSSRRGGELCLDSEQAIKQLEFRGSSGTPWPWAEAEHGKCEQG
jgi:hypothetical protein